MTDLDANEHIKYNVEMLLGRQRGLNTIGRYSSSISLVPSIFRDHCPELFNPTVVSIGPLHHEDEILNESEGFKWTCMYDFLDCLSAPEMLAALCLRKVNESIQKIRTCYVGIRRCTTDNELARMMVIDACFILQFLSLSGKDLDVFLWTQICRDLLLVENQIPLFVLKDIFELTILKSKPSASLIEHIKPLLEFGHRCLFTGHLGIPNDLADRTDLDHILGLLHKCYRPAFPCHVSSDTSNVLNAMELEKAGVSFRPNQDASWPIAINIMYSSGFPWFWVKPTIIIPHLYIHEHTEVLLRNMIAYEHTSKVDRYFTSFMSAIDDLVDTRHDIAKLVESGVVVNDLDSNEEAANMINKICKNASKCNFYSKQWEELDAYYNRYTTVVRRTYFSNPWNSINLLAGVILFILSGVQTYFTINPA